MNDKLKNKTVIFCDLDGTLIETISGETFPKGIWDMRIKFYSTWAPFKYFYQIQIFVHFNSYYFIFFTFLIEASNPHPKQHHPLKIGSPHFGHSPIIGGQKRLIAEISLSFVIVHSSHSILIVAT